MRKAIFCFILFVGILSTVPSSNGRTVAYIYSTDSSSANDYKSLLVSAGFTTDLTLSSGTSVTDFSKYDLIIVGSDTGYLSTSDVDVNKISSSGKKVIGLGEGGYAFFGKLGLETGWGHGWHGSENSINTVSKTHTIFNKPKSITIPTNNIIQLYSSTGHVGIYLPSIPSNVIVLGRESSDNSHYPFTLEDSKYLLWGFTASPISMTQNGKDLFVNTLNFLAPTPPYIPSSPSPSNSASDQSINPTLSWSGGDPDGDTVTYTVYLDTNSNPTSQKCSGTTTSCSVSGLNYNTKYYWKVTASDGRVPLVTGPIWNFITQNRPPYQPSTPSPLNGADAQLVNPTLTWNGGDPDGDTVTYTVYFDTNSNPTTQKCTGTTTSCSVSGLNYNTKYYWKVTASDGKAPLVTGPVWNFITQNRPPYQPSTPSPLNGADAQLVNPALTWNGGDPDSGDTVTYTVYFDTNSNPTTQKCSGTTTSCSVSGLNYNTKYYWKVTASDGKAPVVPGPVWNFATQPPLSLKYTFQTTEDKIPIHIDGLNYNSPNYSNWPNGTDHTVIALPELNDFPTILYQFQNWSGVQNSSDGTIHITAGATNAGNYTANYKKYKYFYLTIRFSCPGELQSNCTSLRHKDEGWYISGTVRNLKYDNTTEQQIFDNSGLKFKEWRIDRGMGPQPDNNNPTSLTIDKNISVVAYFERDVSIPINWIIISLILAAIAGSIYLFKK